MVGRLRPLRDDHSFASFQGPNDERTLRQGALRQVRRHSKPLLRRYEENTEELLAGPCVGKSDLRKDIEDAGSSQPSNGYLRRNISYDAGLGELDEDDQNAEAYGLDHGETAGSTVRLVALQEDKEPAIDITGGN